ncbi:hypothetical protein [Sporomusa acidovorans]|uniref:Transposase IS116/IS110/IS902 family protein n=1 Tax=Sporomusa acidovorans (strain ATCC 49682 / DSM 3132 / Mol) TaxID=1123286 RepID=A0ABZ3J689_SPOA4|nr:hypothetical protein [Sporomusa acidovorans]OZC13591.1 hypothetical protein SPACI_56530 [Sporomusa acidovorans DSM 3132]SDE90549.1 hypothetical protein SAMN04488499_10261 [Sporomusa acidovorans]SDF72148.1 hypothetical protein SAMN04488499_10721 [Sporomusa acidovorans]
MALKIVYPICCGIDVHKTFVVACIASSNSKGITAYKRHRFSTFTKGLNGISRAGCYIKPLLVQCATAVIKSEKHPEIRNRYLQLKRRRGHKRAIIAIARMLLTAIYHILKTKEPYNPSLYKQSDVRPVVHHEFTIKEAILLIQAQGYQILAPTP